MRINPDCGGAHSRDYNQNRLLFPVLINKPWASFRQAAILFNLNDLASAKVHKIRFSSAVGLIIAVKWVLVCTWWGERSRKQSSHVLWAYVCVLSADCATTGDSDRPICFVCTPEPAHSSFMHPPAAASVYSSIHPDLRQAVPVWQGWYS